MNWQPLETAPKDGTFVLMYRNGTVDTARWYDDWMFGRSAWGNGSWSYPDHALPSHWMPLPEPPQGIHKTEGQSDA